MGIVRNPANTMRRGRVGETTYYISGGQQIARQALNSSNFGESARRSEAQQRRRVLWANLVNFYKASASWMPKAFESKKRNQSDYNKFIQVNIANSTIALTKSEAAAGACVVSGYVVSQGSLPSIAITPVGVGASTNISVGDLIIDASTTVAEFTRAVVDNNANIRVGQQLSFVSYQQSRDSLNVPRIVCRCYEVTLNEESATPLRDHLPEFCSQSVDGLLATNNNISEGGFTYILSEVTTSGLKVSTQQLMSINHGMIDEYSSTAKLKEAIASYGLDKEVILSPTGTVTQVPEAQPNFISYVEIDGTKYRPGSYIGKIGDLQGKTMSIVLANPYNKTLTDIMMQTTDMRTYGLVDVVSTGSSSFSGVIGSYGVNLIINAIAVFADDETMIAAEFDASETGGDL